MTAYLSTSKCSTMSLSAAVYIELYAHLEKFSVNAVDF
jgi:hypothetical protein